MCAVRSVAPVEGLNNYYFILLFFNSQKNYLGYVIACVLNDVIKDA